GGAAPKFTYAAFAKELDAQWDKGLREALEHKVDGKGKSRWDAGKHMPRDITEAEQARAQAEAKDAKKSSGKALDELRYKYYDTYSQRIYEWGHRQEYVTIPAQPDRFSAGQKKREPGLGEERVETKWVQRDAHFPYVQQIGHGRLLDLGAAMRQAQAEVEARGMAFSDYKTYETQVNKAFAPRIVAMLTAAKRLAGEPAEAEAKVMEALEGRGRLPMREELLKAESVLSSLERQEVAQNHGMVRVPDMPKRWSDRAVQSLNLPIEPGAKR
ncbi:MAG: hypothetical protein K2Q01_06580, partial [Rickettsiales bacterium]|nr:hypothetical protein [Rickettsiales bacterium]